MPPENERRRQAVFDRQLTGMISVMPVSQAVVLAALTGF